MSGSLFLYIGHGENETFDELATAMPTNDTVSTAIIGAPSGSDSQELAQLFTKRLRKQVFVSCNVAVNNLNRPLIIKRIVDEMKTHVESF